MVKFSRKSLSFGNRNVYFDFENRQIRTANYPSPLVVNEEDTFENVLKIWDYLTKKHNNRVVFDGYAVSYFYVNENIIKIGCQRGTYKQAKAIVDTINKEYLPNYKWYYLWLK